MPRDAQPERFPSAGPSKFVSLTHRLAVNCFRRSAFMRNKAANIGEIADYVSWLQERFGKVAPKPTREDVWAEMAKRCKGPVHGIEFGVAWGYATHWWTTRLTGPDIRWDGFDRFTGLPRSWRNLGEGAFDADGQPPALDDARVTWHVGDVEDHLGELDLSGSPATRRLVLFDLDIYEPSAVAWRHLRDHLSPGDILYFDEAFDSDERWLLNNDVLPEGDYEFIAASPMALAIAVKSIRTSS